MYYIAPSLNGIGSTFNELVDLETLLGLLPQTSSTVWYAHLWPRPHPSSSMALVQIDLEEHFLPFHAVFSTTTQSL
jgi:hypothetical protein